MALVPCWTGCAKIGIWPAATIRLRVTHFLVFWTKGKEADATSMKLAAAAILTKRKETAAQGLTIFEAAMNSSPSDPQRTNINLALIEGYEALEKYDKVAPICLELIKQYPESRQVFNNGTFALRVLGKTDDADQLAEDRFSRIPDDLDAIRALSWNAIDRKDYAKAHALDKKIIDQGRGEPEEFNRIAWYSLFRATFKPRTSSTR